MKTATVSPKRQVVIPQAVREAMGLATGTRVHVFCYDNRIEFIPERRMRRMRGFLKGIDPAVPREADRA